MESPHPTLKIAEEVHDLVKRYANGETKMGDVVDALFRVAVYISFEHKIPSSAIRIKFKETLIRLEKAHASLGRPPVQ